MVRGLKEKKALEKKQREERQKKEEEEAVGAADGGLETRLKNKGGMWSRVAEGGADYIRENVLHRIEFQTLRRLRKTRFIFFTVRTICDPLSTVEKYPGAAGALAAHIRRKSYGERGESGELPLKNDLQQNRPIFPLNTPQALPIPADFRLKNDLIYPRDTSRHGAAG